MAQKGKKITFRYKLYLGIFAGVSALFICLAYYFYQMAFTPNILVEPSMEERYVYIPEGIEFQTLSEKLEDERVIKDRVSFNVISKQLDYDENIKAGRYLLQPKMNNLDAVRLLRSGAQSPVKVTFNQYLRFLPDLAGKISNNLALDSAELATYLLDDKTARKYDFDTDNFIGMFLPNTYEMYWTDSKEEVVERLSKEYQKFWTEERKKKAEELGMTPKEVAVLASIVDAETKFRDEKARIAGVYINRLEREMPLQADPTLVFAHKDFTIKRVLNRHKEIESPYNTYKYAGLPPGPIRLPSLSGLKAVLNPEEHQYIFFCAKDDLSGYHAFAKTNAEHEKNARRYHRALNKRGIK